MEINLFLILVCWILFYIFFGSQTRCRIFVFSWWIEPFSLKCPFFYQCILPLNLLYLSCSYICFLSIRFYTMYLFLYFCILIVKVLFLIKRIYQFFSNSCIQFSLYTFNYWYLEDSNLYQPLSSICLISLFLFLSFLPLHFRVLFIISLPNPVF